MKDGFMILVLFLVMLSPFFPLLLKTKCPLCRKRKLEHLDTEKAAGEKGSTFITFYHCHACASDFQQEKSGPLVKVDTLPIAETYSSEQLSRV